VLFANVAEPREDFAVNLLLVLEYSKGMKRQPPSLMLATITTKEEFGQVFKKRMEKESRDGS
jgi:hypothetical protein